MRFIARILAVCVPLFGALGLDAEEPVSMSEVRRLVVAVALLDFPVEQTEFRDLIALPESVQPSWGSSDPRGTFWYWPILRDADGSSFNLKVVYGGSSSKDPKGYPLITAVDVVYRRAGLGDFVPSLNDIPMTRIERYREKMKAHGLSPAEFTSGDVFRRFIQEVVEDENLAQIEMLKKRKLNQPVEPTPASAPH